MSGLSQQERSEFDSRFAQIRSIHPTTVIPKSDRFKADLSKVGVGGVIKLGGKTYTVTASAIYTEVGKNWAKKTKSPYTITELVLFCLENGETAYIEWSKDDGLEICFTDRKISGRELGRQIKYDDGTVVDLSDIDEICKQDEDLVFDGVTYPYDDDADMVFESSDGRQFFVNLADFGDEKTGKWLTVESWTSTPQNNESWEYEVWLSHTVQANAIEVISLGKKDSSNVR